MQNSKLAVLAIGAILVVGFFALRADDPKTSFDFKGFDEVSVSNGIQLTLSQAEDFEIQAVAKQGDLKRLRIKRRGDTLLVERKRGWGFLNWFMVDEFHVTIAMPILKELEASSGARATVASGLAGLEVIEASSGAFIQTNDVGAADLEVNASSGANIKAVGRCDHVKADVSSGANMDLSALKCETAELEASSGSSLSAFSSANATAQASSGASIRIYGGGTFTSEMSSGGTVRPAN